MRALVTGARGFVGTHLVGYLRASGDEVVGTDRDSGPDLLDTAAVIELIERVGPQVVYHLGGQSDVRRSWDEPAVTFATNVGGTHAVLEGCVRAGIDRVLVVSSAAVYGIVDPDRLPVAEGDPMQPVSPYAGAKAAAEMLCIQAHLGAGLGVVRARAFNHFGPGQREGFVVAGLAARVARAEREGLDAIRTGNLAPRRDFTDVRDVVRAYRLLATAGEPGAAYNVCSGNDIAIGAVAAKLVDLAQRPLALVEDPMLHRPADLPVMRGDPARIESDTGWRPEIDFDTTLADVLDEARKRAANTGSGT